MPLVRRHVIKAQAEPFPGVESDFAAAVDIELKQANFSQTRSLIEDQPVGDVLTPVAEGIGRGQAQVTTQAHFKGSGTATVAPDYQLLLQACNFEEASMVTLTIGAGGLTKAILDGSHLTGATSGAVAVVLRPAAVAATGVRIYLLTAATFSNGETLNSDIYGGSVGTAAVSGALPQSGIVWGPVSRALLKFDVAGVWAVSSPSQGAVMAFVDPSGGPAKGAALFVSQAGDTITCVYIFGSWAAGDAISAGGGSNSVHATLPNISQVQAPTISLKSVRDSLSRVARGARGTFGISADAAGPGRIDFTFTGIATTYKDELATSAPPNARRAPRWVRAPGSSGGALLGNIRVPFKRYELQMNNQVTMSPDANRDEGDAFALVQARDTTLILQVDQTGMGVFDFWGKWRDGLLFPVSIIHDGGNGNRMGIHAPACQIAELSDDDADGVATHTVTLKPRYDVLGTSVRDNEVCLTHD